jgi:excisionase family DNA binding protein
MAHFESQPKKMTKKPATSVEKLLLSRQEAAELLSISRRSLDYLIANRAINVRRIGSRVLIPSQDLLRFASVDHPERLVG